MKMKYEPPIANVTKFKSDDIISTSSYYGPYGYDAPPKRSGVHPNQKKKKKK